MMELEGDGKLFFCESLKNITKFVMSGNVQQCPAMSSIKIKQNLRFSQTWNEVCFFLCFGNRYSAQLSSINI